MSIFIHMFFGCIMYTNPSLFEAHEGPKTDFPKFDFIFPGAPTKEELAAMPPAEAFFRQRVMFFHQQLYLVFVVCAIALFIGGKFMYGLIMLILA